MSIKRYFTGENINEVFKGVLMASHRQTNDEESTDLSTQKMI